MTRWPLPLLAAVAAALLAPDVRAKDGDATAGLRWRRTYREALLEARLRNVPVLVTRQKDG